MGTGRVDIVAYMMISFGLLILIHCPWHVLYNIMSTKSYTQFNDEAQIRNYRHDKQGVPASYSVDVEGLRFLFFDRKLLHEQKLTHHWTPE